MFVADTSATLATVSMAMPVGENDDHARRADDHTVRVNGGVWYTSPRRRSLIWHSLQI